MLQILVESIRFFKKQTLCSIFIIITISFIYQNIIPYEVVSSFSFQA